MVKITETSIIDPYELQKLKKEKDFLMVGKSDKTVNVVSQGQVIPIKELAAGNRTSDYAGSLSIPTTEGRPYVIQYGLTVVAPDTSIDVVFSSPFPNRCFQVQLTLRDAADNSSSVEIKAIPVDNTKFTIKRIGGTVNDTIQWMAFGF